MTTLIDADALKDAIRHSELTVSWWQYKDDFIELVDDAIANRPTCETCIDWTNHIGYCDAHKTIRNAEGVCDCWSKRDA